MKKTFLLSLSLLTSTNSLLSKVLPQTFSINDKTDQESIENFFDTLKKSNAVYLKHGKITQEWIALSNEFETKINALKENIKNIELIPHTDIFKLPAVTIDGKKEEAFKNILSKINSASKTIYTYDADLVKKAFYALIHHYFIIVKQNGKYIIILGTSCKNEAERSASDTKKTLELFISNLPWLLKARLAVLMPRG